MIIYPNLPEVMDVLREVCEDRGCEMSIADFGRMIQLDTDLSGQTLLWKGQDLIFKLPLIGDYQMRNATVALTAIEILQEKGWDISDMAIIEGMSEAEWQARFELLSYDPVFILDGGHNSQCAEAVAESLRKYLPNTKLTLVIGMLRDKDYSAALDILLPFAEKCYCLTPESERALSADSLAELIREKGVSAESFETAEEILTKCFDEEAPVLAFGSLYMAGEIRKTHRRLSKKRIRDKAKSAREALSEEERDSFSKEICKKIAETEEYKKANIIFAYKYAGGEVRTDELEKAALAEGKLIAYPVCGAKSISNHLRADRENDYNLFTDGKDMVAVIPGEERDAWKESGCYGIREPALEKGKMIEPSGIDLIIAPCTSFDEELNRLGMGGGYYDGYLPKCENAKTFAVAFEVQKSDKIPTDEHDYAVNAVITEKTVYL
ncbi:MAG: 5-formyltetrahydrofolate cyclo-ligase [Mogibacterium sp.]|nr:5-formyltetrahydrofolate cyclo-ligase [Mogibacterium sp.]